MGNWYPASDYIYICCHRVITGKVKNVVASDTKKNVAVKYDALLERLKIHQQEIQ